MKWIPAALSLLLITSTTIPANSQSATRKKYGRIAEVSLAGISLYDSGRTIIKKYGSPDLIEGLSIGSGGGNGGGGGPAGGGGAAPQGRNPGGGGGSPGAGEMSPNGITFPADGPLEGFIGDPFSQNGTIKQLAPGGEDGGGAGGSSRPPKGETAGPGGGGGGSTTSTNTQFTRWVYKRPNARYAFVLDKFNKVVQIEAVGINDPKINTSRGIKFGSTFGQLMERYYEPDGYDISGDGFIVRFLQRGKVAFRFSRLEAGKPHRVTGIVVAAGKS